MDHNASKCFRSTLLTDEFHQIRNNRFEKKVGLYFMLLGTYNRFLIPVLPNNRNQALFELNFLLRNFRHVVWICGPARMMKTCRKEATFVPCSYVFKLILLILFEYVEKLSGKFDPRPLFFGFQ
jgi:hypothetical protein